MTGLITRLSRLLTDTDEDAMARVKARDDHQAFARLVGRWEKPIRQLCARMTGDIHRAEDLKQETFVRLFEKRKAYQNTGRFSTYLWRIALNLCYDELRRQERRRRFIRETPPSEDSESESFQFEAQSPGPDVRAAQSEESDLVRGALLQLPELYRTVLVLRHYEGLKLAEIADVLEIPEG
ncbi:MAG TPA: sigma-70 family RNA polymerase sigma factor, partial [Verrucomicrobiae bacterium]|nr:sigma-70 family RNA polymerase sigma factor [Verrucomicrobiae bacterium]